MMNKIELSALNKTWIFDLDGTIVKHNGYKIDGYDTLLQGAKEFFYQIPDDDMIIILSARSNEYRSMTERFLKNNNIRYNLIVFDVPTGERILINDKKNSGLKTAYSLNTIRDRFLECEIKINSEL